MAYQTLPNGSILKFASRPSGLFNIFVGLLYLFVFIDYVSSQPTLAPLTGAATWQNVETALRATCAALQAQFQKPQSQFPQINQPSGCPALDPCSFPAQQVSTCSSAPPNHPFCTCPTSAQFVSFNQLSVSSAAVRPTSADVAKDNQCRVVGIAPEFASIARNNSLVKLSAGFPSGVYSSYPAENGRSVMGNDSCLVDSGSCATVDPRRSYWYASAVSGSKNLILIVDRSDAMNAFATPIKEAMLAALDTVSPSDYVTLILAGSSAETLLRGATLLPGTESNIANLKNAVRIVTFGGASDWNNAVVAGIDQFEATPVKACNTMMLIFGATRGTGPVEQTLRTRNAPGTIKVFTYSLGSSANFDLLRAIACQNQGVYRQILTVSTEDLVNQVLDYYTYITESVTVADPYGVFWSEPRRYSDLSPTAQQQYSLASLACFDPAVNTRVLGVVSALVPSSVAPGSDRSPNVCRPFSLSSIQLELFRGAQKCEGSISLALGLGIGGAFVVIVIFLGCLGCCGYFDFVLGVFYGMLLLVQFPIMIALPWRPVFMFIGVFCGDSGPSIKRGAGKAFLHLGLFFLDLFTIPAFLFTLVFLVDAPYMFYKMFNGKLYKKTQSAKAHYYIWLSAVYTCRDVFLYYFLLPMTLLQPWRFVYVIIDSVLAENWRERRRIVLSQWMLTVFDFFTVPFFIISFIVSPWRWVAVWRDFKDILDDPNPTVITCAPSSMQRRVGTTGWFFRNNVEFLRVMWIHTCSVFFDLLLSPLIVLTLGMPYRFIALAASFTLIRTDAVSRWKIILIQAGLALLDILSLPAAALIFLTLYRLPAFRRKLIHFAQQPSVGQYFLSDLERTAGTWLRISFSPVLHRQIWKEAVQIVIDGGVLILWIISLIAPWRAVFALIDLFGREEKQGGRRMAVILQCRNALLDIVSLAPALLQLITVYRVKGIIAQTNAKTTNWRNRMCGWPLTPPDPEKGGFLWDEQALALRYTIHLHKTIWQNFAVFCVDVMCLFAGPLSIVFPWRGFWFARDVYLADTAKHRRLSAFVNLALLVLDLFSLPFFLIVLVTVYRLPSLFKNWKEVATDPTTSTEWGSAIRAANPDENMYRLFHSARFHLKIVIQAGHVLLELMLVIVALLTLAAPWRFIAMVHSMITASKPLPGQQPPTRGWALHYRRMAPLIQFALMLLDFAVLPFFIPVIVTIFRFVISIKLWKSEVMLKPESAKIWGYNKNIRTPDPSEHMFIFMHSPKVHLIAFLMFVALMLELLGAVIAVITLVVPWRFVSSIYDIIVAPKFSDNRFSRLRALSLMLAYALLDIVSLIPMLFMTLTVYRLPTLFKRWKDVGADPSPDHPGWLLQPGGHTITPAEMHPFFRTMNTLDFHKALWVEFWRWLLDVAVIFSSLIMILTPWRIIFALSALSTVWKDPARQDQAAAARRGKLLKQVRMALADLAMVPLLALLTVFIWRSIALIWSIVSYSGGPKECTRNNHRVHWLILQQAGLLALDIMVIPPAFFLVVTVYRFPGYLRKVQSKDDFQNKRAAIIAHGILLHKYLYYAFFYILYDALAITMFIVCVVTIIPVVFLATDFSERDRSWFIWRRIRKHTVIWGLLTIPLWLTSPVLILSFVMIPFNAGLRYFFKYTKPLPKPLKTYLLSVAKFMVKESARKGLGWGRFWAVGPATLVAVVFFFFNWAMMAVAGFNFLFYSILSYGLPFCPDASCWTSCCSCCHKGAFFVTWWILVMPLFGFVQFVLWHLPRVIALFVPFWSTIFALCSPSARAEGTCIDFYNWQEVPDIPWWLVFLVWEIVYAHSIPYFMKFTYKYIWKKIPG